MQNQRRPLGENQGTCIINDPLVKTDLTRDFGNAPERIRYTIQRYFVAFVQLFYEVQKHTAKNGCEILHRITHSLMSSIWGVTKLRAILDRHR